MSIPGRGIDEHSAAHHLKRGEDEAEQRGLDEDEVAVYQKYEKRGADEDESEIYLYSK